MESKLKKLTELGSGIIKLSDTFRIEHELNITRGNKAAGVRARKATLEMGRILGEYRKVSKSVEKGEE
jgi:hypothetical protein